MIKQSFNRGWFYKEGGSGSLDLLTGSGAAPVPVTLPHDASIGMPRNPDEPNGSGNGFFQEKNYTYTKKFSLDAADAGKNVCLEFESVYQNAYVYINGSYAANNPYGYGNFYVDATKLVKFDEENEIKVIVKNGVPSGRWYTGGGIYRDVSIMIGERLHIAADGVQVSAIEAEADQAVLRAKTRVEYTGIGTRDIFLVTKIFDATGAQVAQDRMAVTVEEHSAADYIQKLYVENPSRWDEDNPYLYTYQTIIEENGAAVDEERGSFGIRKLQLDRAHGLRVNGRVVKLRGGCIHHDNGITGTAEFPHAADLRVKRLKEAGFNSIRSSHYPMSRRLLEACDKYGVYVMDEFADVWSTTKVDFDYGTHMPQWWEHDVTNLVKKAYNHPCVIMYSIGNEIPETGDKFDVQWGKKIADQIRYLDDTRYVTNSLNLMLSTMNLMPKLIAEMTPASPEGETAGTAAASPGAETAGASADSQATDTAGASADSQATDTAGASAASQEGEAVSVENAEINSLMTNLGDLMEAFVGSDLVGDAIEEAAGQVDLIGYNYAASRYEKDGVKYPNRIIVGSETYPRDLDVNWALVEKYPYIVGDYDWTAWDYLGEAGIGKISYDGEQSLSFYAPYPYKAAYCGDINLLGDARPIAYWRQMIWGLREKPYVSVQPPQHHDDPHNMTQWSMTDAVRSWNWKGYEGKSATVEVYGIGDEAELFINGKSSGRKTIGETKKYIAYFETAYEPGTLEAVVYKDGVEIGRDSIVTAADEVQIAAQSDGGELPADESDIVYVEIALKDAAGNLNPGADNKISISVEGPAVVCGFGSADPSSEENYYDTSARAYEGRLRAALRGTGEKGTVTVTLSSEGLKDAVVTVEAV